MARRWRDDCGIQADKDYPLTAFANRLYTDLQNEGDRCWFAPQDLKIGDKIRDLIDESIKLRDKLLLILSEANKPSKKKR